MIFVDSSFWIAVRNVRDRHHADAVRLLEGVAGERLVTSNHVVGETWTFLRRRVGHDAAVDFLDLVQVTPRLRIERVPDELEREAWQWLQRHDERPYSFVDATSFALMRSLRITEVLAFDTDFQSAGFRELRV